MAPELPSTPSTYVNAFRADRYTSNTGYTRSRYHTLHLASQARVFRAVAELTAREAHEEEELLPELLQREKSLVAFENVIVTWDPLSGFIA